ncbi:MAG: tetratricopeptide repeat protein [Bacteroidales bacterium]
MMTADTFIEYMSGRQKLDAASLQELVQLARRYPYFQAVRLLYLKNLSEVHSVRYADELRRNAVYMPDRKRMFGYLDNGEYLWSALLQRKENASALRNETPVDQFSLIDNFLQHAGDESYPEQLEDLLPVVQEQSPTDYIHMLLDKPDAAALPVNDRQQTLIDTFIEKDETEGVFIPTDDLIPESARNQSKEDSLIRDDSFLTESLAKIYIKQKKYSKALEIIKKLSLKYPEKNVYFADQIRFLEKIITNIKTE